MPDSTEKVEQLIGDRDHKTGAPVRSRTETRWGIRGTDLGYPFRHRGRTCFLFGDTLGPKGGDSVACTGARRGDKGVRLDFLEDGKGNYLRVMPEGRRMGPFDVPTGGVDIDGTPWLFVRRGHKDPTRYSTVVRWDRDGERFTTVRELSRLPDGKFVQAYPRLLDREVPGVPPGGPWVLVWGTGTFRESPVWLAIVPAAHIATGEGTRYFAGLDAAGDPVWSPREREAVPVIDTPTVGNLNVTWVEGPDLWLASYDQREPLSVVMRTAPTPWGPWGASQIVLRRRDWVGELFHGPGRDDGLAGPVIGEDSDPDRPGGPYAPYVVEPFTRHRDGRVDVYWVLSTWNPYTVVLMHSQLALAAD